MPPPFVHKKEPGFLEVVADQPLSYAGFFAPEISTRGSGNLKKYPFQIRTEAWEKDRDFPAAELLRDPRGISHLYLSGCNDGSDFAGFDVQKFHVPMDPRIPVSPIDGYDIGGGVTPSKLSPGSKDPLFQRIHVHRDHHPFPVSAVVKHRPSSTRTPLLAGARWASSTVTFRARILT